MPHEQLTLCSFRPRIAEGGQMAVEFTVYALTGPRRTWNRQVC